MVMLSSIVKMATSTMIMTAATTVTQKKRSPAASWDHHHDSCCINEKAVATYRCRSHLITPAVSSPSSSSSSSSLSSSSCRSLMYLAATDSAAVANVNHEEAAAITKLPGGLHPEQMPKHVAIIMDGHGRWAEERGLPTEKGHLAGSDAFKRIVLAACTKLQVKALTFYAFSTENWSRSQAEIGFLMSGYEDVIRSYVMEMILRHELRFSVIGDKSRLPHSLQAAVSEAEESSKGNKGMHLVMAMSYSGRLDITEASRKIARKVEEGVLVAKDINDEIVEQHLMTSMMEVAEPDLLIRTSGEMRVSNFFLWQLAYTEFYFLNKMFPDLDEADLVEAMASFQGRRRRYGRRS